MFNQLLKSILIGSSNSQFYIACTTTSTLLSVVSVLSVCFITYSMFKKEECSIFDYLDISFVIAMFNSDD